NAAHEAVPIDAGCPARPPLATPLPALPSSPGGPPPGPAGGPALRSAASPPQRQLAVPCCRQRAAPACPWTSTSSISLFTSSTLVTTPATALAAANLLNSCSCSGVGLPPGRLTSRTRALPR